MLAVYAFEVPFLEVALHLHQAGATVFLGKELRPWPLSERNTDAIFHACAMILGHFKWKGRGQVVECSVRGGELREEAAGF
jgi:hypothetical protein